MELLTIIKKTHKTKNKNACKQRPDEDCIYQREYGAKISGDFGKGIYPYEYIDTVEKMNDSSFPPLSEFETILGNKVFKEDYDTASFFFQHTARLFETITTTI